MPSRNSQFNLPAVARAARRRLRVSFGLLLLVSLSATIGFELLYARSERRIARRLAAVEKLGYVGFRDKQGGMHVGSDEEAVRANYWVDSVYLYAEHANRPSLEALVSLKQVAIVKFNGPSFVDRHFRYVESLDYVRELFANGTCITDENLARLSSRPDLEMLSLNDTEISDASIPSLIAMPKLRRLVAAKTRISPEGYERLKTALPDCEIDYAPRPDVSVPRESYETAAAH